MVEKRAAKKSHASLQQARLWGVGAPVTVRLDA